MGKNNYSFIQYVGIFLLCIMCVIIYEYKSVLIYNVLFFIPLFYIEQNREIPFLYRCAYILLILCGVTYLYEIIYLPSLKQGFSPLSSLRINQIIMAWSYFVAIAYLIMISIKYYKISLPLSLFSYKTVLLLSTLGAAYILYILANLDSEYAKANHLNGIIEKLLYYRPIFLLTFLINGIFSLLLYTVFPIQNYIKVTVIYIVSIYILSYASSVIGIFIAFSGLDSIVKIFPLSVLAFVISTLAMKFSIVFAFFYSIWAVIIIFFDRIKYKYQTYVEIVLLVLLFLSIFLISIELSTIDYPFNRIHFN